MIPTSGKTERKHAMPIQLRKVAEELEIPAKVLRKEGIKAFLERELRWLRIEILSLCQKYGVSSWEEMNELIMREDVEEGKILEDFQRVDHLTAKSRKIELLLESL